MAPQTDYHYYLTVLSKLQLSVVLVKKGRRTGSHLVYGAGFVESPGIRRNVVNNATPNHDRVTVLKNS